MKRERRYLVGLGNPLRGDDGIGPLVAETVAQRGLDRQFEAVAAFNDGMRVLSLFRDDTLRVVIVDCAFMGLGPGECAVFGLNEVLSKKAETVTSTHGGDLLQWIERAGTLGLELPDIRLIGIQPASLEEGAGVSPLLMIRLDEYVRLACETADAGA